MCGEFQVENDLKLTSSQEVQLESSLATQERYVMKLVIDDEKSEQILGLFKNRITYLVID